MTFSPGKPAIAFAPASSLMPGMMPCSCRQSRNGRPFFVFWCSVSSNRMAPLMAWPKPGVVTINSRQERRASSVWGMPRAANRLWQVGMLSSMASRPLSGAMSARTVGIRSLCMRKGWACCEDGENRDPAERKKAQLVCYSKAPSKIAASLQNCNDKNAARPGEIAVNKALNSVCLPRARIRAQKSGPRDAPRRRSDDQ